MRAILAAAVLLSACSTGWPAGSYVGKDQRDTDVIATAIADYVSGAIKPGYPVTVVPAGPNDPITAPLNEALDHAGVVQQPGATQVRYLVTPFDSGVLLRVSIDNNQGMARVFAGGDHLAAASPSMVLLP